MKNIGVIGTGNLGKRLAGLLCRNNLQDFMVISDKNTDELEMLCDKYNLCSDSNKEVIEDSDIIFLTVKPHNIKDVCDEINEHTNRNIHAKKKTIISAAAGVPIHKINSWTNDNYDVIRMMPNIPISTGDGSIVWCAKDICDIDKLFLNNITEGPSHLWVDDERLIDSGTVISGCGPAYVAKFFETYIKIGTDMGFTEEQARILMKGVFSGTSKLLEDSTGNKIMKEVASKGGATEEALRVLDCDGFDDIIRKSAFSSLDRISEITKSLD